MLRSPPPPHTSPGEMALAVETASVGAEVEAWLQQPPVAAAAAAWLQHQRIKTSLQPPLPSGLGIRLDTTNLSLQRRDFGRR